MRGSTAAEINISLLPRNCCCGKFACSAVWEETFSLAFVGNLPMVLYWKRLLFPNFFGIRLIRYRRGPLVVRNMRAVRKTGSCGTRRIFRVTRCKKTGFSGTGVIFGTGNLIFWYRTDIGARKPECVFRDPSAQNSLLWYATHFQGPRCTQQPRLFSSVPKEGNGRFLIAYCARFHIFVNGQRKGYEKERP